MCSECAYTQQKLEILDLEAAVAYERHASNENEMQDANMSENENGRVSETRPFAKSYAPLHELGASNPLLNPVSTKLPKRPHSKASWDHASILFGKPPPRKNMTHRTTLAFKIRSAVSPRPRLESVNILNPYLEFGSDGKSRVEWEGRLSVEKAKHVWEWLRCVDEVSEEDDESEGSSVRGRKTVMNCILH